MQPPTTPNQPAIPAVPKLARQLGFGVAGLAAFGAILDAISNSIAFFTVLRAAIFTATVLVLQLIAGYVLRRSPLRISHGVAIRSLGPKPSWMLLGSIVLVWVGAIANLALPSTPGAPATSQTLAPTPTPKAIHSTHLAHRAVRFENESCTTSAELRSSNQPQYGISTLTPYFKGMCPGTGLEVINSRLVEGRDKSVNDFIAELKNLREYARKEGLEVPPFGPEGIYFERECRPRLISRKIISVLCSEHAYRFPAAHSARSNTSYNFELDDATARPFSLDNILVPGEFAGTVIDKLVRQEAIAQGTDPEWIKDAGIDDAMGEGFGVTQDGLVFLLGEYVTGPYVEGSREVLVPFEQLRGVLRSDGALANAMER